MEKNALFVKLKTYVDAQSGSYFGTLATTNIDALNTLKSNLDQVLHQINAPDTWDDSIAWTINDETSSGIPEMIIACEEPALTALGKLDAVISGLQNPLKQYDELVDKYNSKEEEFKKKFPSIPSQTKTTTKTDPVTGEVKTITESNPDYNTYLSLKGELETINDAIDLCTPIITDEINTLKGLLSEVGSQDFSNANQAGIAFGDIEQREGTPSDYGYESDYKVKEVVQKDKDGNIVGVAYTVTDADGNVVESGSYKYDAEGKVDKVQRYKKPPEPTPIPEDAPLSTYIDDEVVPVEETSETTVTEVDDLSKLPKPIKDKVTPATVEKLEDIAEETGGPIVLDETTSDKKFSDGSELETTTQSVGVQVEEGEGNGVINPPNDTIVIQETEEGKLTTPDGVEHGYQRDTEYTEKGNVEHSEEIISDKDGNVEVTKTQDKNAEYEDTLLGVDVYASDTEIKEGDTVTTTTGYVMTDENGDVLCSDQTTVSKKVDETGKPTGEGTIVRDDGTRVEYVRNETTGKLEYTEHSVDKHGKEVSYGPYDVPEDKYTFKVTDPDGTVRSYEVNPNNEMDMEFVRHEYEKANMDCGANADRAYEGCHFLLGGGETTVSPVWGNTDKTYSFSLLPADD